MADPSSGKVPVIQSMTEAWRFFFAHWTMFIPACAVVAIVAGLTQALFGPGAAAGAGLPVFASMALQTLAAIVLSAAVLRKAVRDEYAAPLGVAFGADELRLLGVLASLMLVFVPLLVLLSFVLAFFVVGRLASTAADLEALFADPEALNDALLSSLGPGGYLALQLFLLACIIILLIVSARLVLVNSATIGERRMVVFQTWSWSRGNVFRVLAALVITNLPAVLASLFLVSLIEAPMRLSAPGAVPAIQLILTAAAGGFIGALLQIPSLALSAHLYKGLRPPDFVPK